MPSLNHLQQVATHYRENIAYQLTRLDQDSPVEYAITLRKLNKWIPDGALVADVGAGAGHYALHLAERSCHIHLIDIAEDLLNACQEKFHANGLARQLLGVHTASADNLHFIASESMHAVILLGPLYHLHTDVQRRMVLQEAHRVLKKGGIVFAGGINRMAVLRELWNADRFSALKGMADIKRIKQDICRFIHSGISSETVFPPLSTAFCATSHQFKEEFAGLFQELEFLGVESFSGHAQSEFFKKEASCQTDWLDLIEITGKTNEGIAASEHFLFIGEKIE